jgi:hypothetical protein
MKKLAWLFSILIFLATACDRTNAQIGTMVAAALTGTAAIGSDLSSSTLTFTPSSIFTTTLDLPPAVSLTSTDTYTPSYTPTEIQTTTPAATITPLFTQTLAGSPTFDFPTVTVNKTHAACMWGPSTEYLWGWDLNGGDTGIVYGRSPYNSWLYVKMSRVNKYCWISPIVVDVTGNPKRVVVQSINLPITNALYAAPTGVTAIRDGDQVTISWNKVWMTLDDDRGYFLDVWVCQKGAYVWMPVGRLSLPDQYHTSYTFTDQQGCSQASGGKLYTVEKHGFTSPATVPWPAFGEAPTATVATPTGVPLTPVPPTETPADTPTPVPTL